MTKQKKSVELPAKKEKKKFISSRRSQWQLGNDENDADGNDEFNESRGKTGVAGSNDEDNSHKGFE